MTNRLNIQTTLENILGSRNVYYQPPESVKMQYPAIVYFRNGIENNHANDSVYNQNVSYEIIVIYKDPDSEIPLAVSQLPLCKFNRRYTADNLYHDVFILYF